MRSVLSLVVFFSAIISCCGQNYNFTHALGTGVATNDLISAPFVEYSPRYILSEFGEAANISVGTHAGLGLQYGYGTAVGSVGYLTVDLPALVEMNFGHAAGPYAWDKAFGFFIGAGAGINYTSQFGAFSANLNVLSFGPMATIGTRFSVFQKSLTLRGGYMVNLNDKAISGDPEAVNFVQENSLNMITLSISYNLFDGY